MKQTSSKATEETVRNDDGTAASAQKHFRPTSKRTPNPGNSDDFHQNVVLPSIFHKCSNLMHSCVWSMGHAKPRERWSEADLGSTTQIFCFRETKDLFKIIWRKNVFRVIFIRLDKTCLLSRSCLPCNLIYSFMHDHLHESRKVIPMRPPGTKAVLNPDSLSVTNQLKWQILKFTTFTVGFLRKSFSRLTLMMVWDCVKPGVTLSTGIPTQHRVPHVPDRIISDCGTPS